MNTEQSSSERNYSTISPSANALLLLKGLTDIPYARAAAGLIMAPEKYEPDYNIREYSLWGRAMHFELRYKSIDQLLQGLDIKNVLELSSGFSFRGLAAVQQNDTYYIDTDLPNIIDTKKDFANKLQDNDKPTGTLEILPLNALDEEQFLNIVDHFPAGNIAIVNEGLLMYLGMDEKRKLCSIIRNVLRKRGGYWITADIYVKIKDDAFLNRMANMQNDKLQQFFKEHNIEENKFEGFEEAEAFFNEEGFIVDKEAEPDYASSPLRQYLIESMTEEQKSYAGKPWKMQTTWRLRLAE